MITAIQTIHLYPLSQQTQNRFQMIIPLQLSAKHSQLFGNLVLLIQGHSVFSYFVKLTFQLAK